MSLSVFVGSKSQPSVFAVIEGFGADPITARRSAIQFARARHSIADPIALSPHEAAVRFRQQVLAAHPIVMPDNMNGMPDQWWRGSGCHVASCEDE